MRVKNLHLKLDADGAFKIGFRPIKILRQLKNKSEMRANCLWKEWHAIKSITNNCNNIPF
jgi:hypothetical protein